MTKESKWYKNALFNELSLYSRLDENELSMMVDQGAVDQLLVDQETEESFRRDHRTTSSTTTSGP